MALYKHKGKEKRRRRRLLGAVTGGAISSVGGAISRAIKKRRIRKAIKSVGKRGLKGGGALTGADLRRLKIQRSKRFKYKKAI